MAVFQRLNSAEKILDALRSFSSYTQFYYRIKEENASPAKQTGNTRTFPRCAMAYYLRIRAVHSLVVSSPFYSLKISMCLIRMTAYYSNNLSCKGIF